MKKRPTHRPIPAAAVHPGETPVHLALVLLAILGLVPTAGSAQEVGKVVLARNDVTATPPGGTARKLGVDDPLSLGLAVVTGFDSRVKMTFDPRGALTLESNARLVLEQTVVDQVTGRRRSTLSLLLGNLRLAISRLFGGDVEVETPAAAIGVKGTDLSIDVDASGRTVVTLYEGEATVRAKAGGTVVVTSGMRTVISPGETPTPPAPYDPSGGTLTAAAGGPAFTRPPETLLDDPVLILRFDKLPIDRGGSGEFPRPQ